MGRGLLQDRGSLSKNLVIFASLTHTVLAGRRHAFNKRLLQNGWWSQWLRALLETSELVREKCSDLGPDPQLPALPTTLLGGSSSVTLFCVNRARV